MNRKTAYNYILAVFIVGAAVLARLSLVAVIGTEAPYLTVYLSVVFVSVLLGLGPGLTAAVVGTVGAEFLIVEHEFGFDFNAVFLARSIVLVTSAAYLGHIGDRLRRSEQSLQARVSQLEQSKELSDALNRINSIINSMLDPDEIMKKAVVEAARAIGCESSALDTMEDGKWTIRYVYNFPEEAIGRNFSSADVPFAEIAARTKMPVVLNDAFNDPRAKLDVQKAYGVRSVMTIPLMIRGAAFGVLFFNYHSRLAVFTDEQIDFASKLSLSVSLALENTQLYQSLQSGEQRLRAIVNSIPDIAWLKDNESRIILVNEAYGLSCGKKPGELIGKTDLDIWPIDLAEKYRADDREVMENGVHKRMEEPLVGPDGTRKWIETIKTPVYGPAGEVMGTVGIARDTTDRKRMEEEIRHMAQHDALTGLPNRRLFIDILNIEIVQARRRKTKLAVLFLDLDRFKEINDTLGHDVGDLLLQEVAARFKGAVRESDTAARIGGDEFNIILADVIHSESVSDIARKIIHSLQGPVVVSGHELHVTASIGISIYPDDGEDTDTLLRYADIAMYHAKESGRNTFRFYNPSINVRSIEKIRMEGWLRQTIARGELSVHYQPQVDIRTKKIAYAEALVRWNHPEHGLLEPNRFLPLAEETGFITSIDEWVLRSVCAQAKAWKDIGFDSFCVTVNLSARQFQRPDLVKLVSSVLKDTGLTPHCLDIEVTEHTAMSNIDRTASQLRELNEIGVHFSIDDFGTGYSSLNYLKKLPIERLKIDKSFIRDIANDSDDRAIISAVTSMARQMGIRTVAEGVETEEQLAFVRDAGCDEAQGFLISRPVTAEQFEELIMKR